MFSLLVFKIQPTSAWLAGSVESCKDNQSERLSQAALGLKKQIIKVTQPQKKKMRQQDLQEKCLEECALVIPNFLIREKERKYCLAVPSCRFSAVSIKCCVKVTQVANTMSKVTLVRQQAGGCVVLVR